MNVNLDIQKTNNQNFGMAIKFKTPEVRTKFIKTFQIKNIENSEKLDRFVKLAEREKDNPDHIIINDYGPRFWDLPCFKLEYNGETFCNKVPGIVHDKPIKTEGDIIDLLEIVADEARILAKQNKDIEYIKNIGTV